MKNAILFTWTISRLVVQVTFRSSLKTGFSETSTELADNEGGLNRSTLRALGDRFRFASSRTLPAVPSLDPNCFDLVDAKAVHAYRAPAATIALVEGLLLFGDSFRLRVTMIADEVLAIEIKGMDHQWV